MNQRLQEVLRLVQEAYEGEIEPASGTYVLADLGLQFERRGDVLNAGRYKDIRAVVPLKRQPGNTMACTGGGRFFSDWRQLRSGIVVRQWVADESGLEHGPYAPQEQMTCYLFI